MKLKPKGRKIYRQKTRAEHLRIFRHNTGAIVLMTVILLVAVFVGYSAGAPILRFLQEREILAPPSQSNTDMEETISSESSLSEETTDTAAEELSAFHGYRLSSSSLFTAAALEQALEEIPAGTTHVIVPLKTKGGNLYYATSLEDAGMSGAVVAALPLETIYTAISQSGCIPVAAVNTLEDSIYPLNFASAAYQIAGSGERWLDAASEDGGKPWLSPFSDFTLAYLSDVAGELADAGFTVILCEGLTFPAFSESDAAQLDPRATAPDRYTALADVVTAMEREAENVDFWVEIDGDEALAGQSEVLQALDGMAISGVLFQVSAESVSETKQLEALAAGMTCIFMGEDDSTSDVVTKQENYVICEEGMMAELTENPVQETAGTVMESETLEG